MNSKTASLLVILELFSAVLLLLLLLSKIPIAHASLTPMKVPRDTEVRYNPSVFQSHFRKAHRNQNLSLFRLFPERALGASTPALGSFPSLYAPRVFRAVLQEGGVRLSWRPHPKNPVESLEYHLQRWRGTEAIQDLALTRGLEYVDSVPCEGIPYHYRLTAVLEREVPTLGDQSRRIRRASPATNLRVNIPRQGAWQSSGLQEMDVLLLQWTQPGLPTQGPFPVQRGESVGSTGWTLLSFRKEETEEETVTSIPRFDSLGRRVILDGQPAWRQKRILRPRSFVTAELQDPCGNLWVETLWLKTASSTH